MFRSRSTTALRRRESPFLKCLLHEDARGRNRDFRNATATTGRSVVASVRPVLPAAGMLWFRRADRPGRLHAKRPRRRTALDRTAGLPGWAGILAACSGPAGGAACHVSGLCPCGIFRRDGGWSGLHTSIISDGRRHRRSLVSPWRNEDHRLAVLWNWGRGDRDHRSLGTEAGKGVSQKRLAAVGRVLLPRSLTP